MILQTMLLKFKVTWGSNSQSENIIESVRNHFLELSTRGSVLEYGTLSQPISFVHLSFGHEHKARVATLKIHIKFRFK